MATKFTPVQKTPTAEPLPTAKLSPTVGKKNRKFVDNFNRNEFIKEGGYMRESTSKDWWVNSGAYFYIGNGVGKTVSGELAENDPRRISYFNNNPGETDNGFHPQNIFRLVTKSKWINYEQSAYFKIDKYILSSDPHRQPSNGLLLFNRYQDGQTLYYAGLRVDGYVTIKKKYQGTYYTMSYVPFLSGTYNRDSSPNLIPVNEWIGIKTVVNTLANNSVNIKLYIDVGKTGNWKKAAEVMDDGEKYSNTPAVSQEGYAGIRTDFMDVEFSNYKIEEISN